MHTFGTRVKRESSAEAQFVDSPERYLVTGFQMASDDMSWGQQWSEILCAQRYNWIDLHDLAHSRKILVVTQMPCKFLYFRRDLPYSTDHFFFLLSPSSLHVFSNWPVELRHKVFCGILHIFFSCFWSSIYCKCFFFSFLDYWLGQHLLAWIWGSLAVEKQWLVIVC